MTTCDFTELRGQKYQLPAQPDAAASSMALVYEYCLAYVFLWRW